MLRDVGAQLVGLDLVVVLRREHHVLDAAGLAVIAIADGHLDLAVRPQVAQGLVAADVGQLAGESMRQRDRKRHELGRLIAGEAEHHPRVAGAADVDAVGDVR